MELLAAISGAPDSHSAGASVALLECIPIDKSVQVK